MTIRSALALLWRDRRHLTLALAGVVFAVVLLALQAGLLLGSLRAASGLVDRTDAAVWVTAPGLRTLAASPPLPEAVYYRLRTLPDVARVRRLIVRPGTWDNPTGGRTPVTVVGFDLDAGLGRPWRLAAGTPAALHLPETVAVDASTLGRLGLTPQRRTAVLGGHRARALVITRGIRPVDDRPFVFTSLANARRYTDLAENHASAFLIQPAAGVGAVSLRDAIRAAIPTVAAFTRDDVRQRVGAVRLFASTAGTTLLLAACLGLLVGGLTVGYALMAATRDHLADYVAWGAEGVPCTLVRRAIQVQAVAVALAGSLLGIAVSLGAAALANGDGTVIALPWRLAAGIGVLVLGMCLVAGNVAGRRVLRLDGSDIITGREPS